MSDMKTGIITGASSGIGAAVAELLFAQGNVNLVLLARRVERLDTLAKELKEKHPNAKGELLTHRCDVTLKAEVDAAVKAATDKFQQVHFLVNNAGVMLLSFQRNLHVEESLKMVDVNIKGPLLTTAALLPHFRQHKVGHIVNVSSDADRKVFPGSAVYSGTKAFLSLYSEGLRSELVKEGLPHVRVTSISSGAVESELAGGITDTDVTDGWKNAPPMKFMSAAEAASVIVWTLNAPDNVNVNNVMFRPVEQAE